MEMKKRPIIYSDLGTTSQVTAGKVAVSSFKLNDSKYLTIKLNTALEEREVTRD